MCYPIRAMKLLEAPERLDPDGMPRQEYLRASPPMFRVGWLDRLTRVHVAVVPAIFVPGIVAFLVLALRDLSAWQVALLVAGGYVVWTLTEYWLHRLVFHFEPDHPVGMRLHWMIHGVHHDHPNDPMRLVMPPSASLPLALVFVAIFNLALPFAQACALSAGFFAGYLAYDLTHFYVHHRRPRGPVGRKLRELHMRHHFQDHDRGYGVSAPWWDHVFGTAPRRRDDA
jgi:sterol desaturase/sphingolipid hydroxylase (fatty acid hydroxylase superfamily)